MKIEIDSENANFYKISSYSDDSFKIKDNIIKSNIVISKDRLIENWFEKAYPHLAVQHLDEIIAWQPEIIILGTGKQLTFPDSEFITYVTSKNIGFEVMDTGAACRSYNLLIDEHRDVVACLFLTDH